MKNTKRALLTSILALVLCCSMLIGTTFAWFTDEVVSGSNVIKSGTLDAELLHSDDNANWKDASKGAIFDYKYWEPGYTQVKYVQIANVGDLAFKFQLNIIPDKLPAAGQLNLADVIDVYVFDANATVDRAAIAAATPVGTLTELMADADGAAYGYLLPASGKGATDVNANEDPNAPRGEITYCIALKMRESAGNEYQNLTVGNGFTVQLLATQYTWENDSFDHKYDEGTDFAPKANVNETGAKLIETSTHGWITANTTFQFQPTQSWAQAQQSPYKDWHADFVVSADADIPAESVILPGYYKAYADATHDQRWIGLSSPDVITKGTEIRLVRTLTDLLGVSGFVPYEAICQWGNDGIGFLCGVSDQSKGTLNGVTLTVELRLYETFNGVVNGVQSANHETGEYITIGTYTYTFGDTVLVGNNEQLDAALQAGVTKIELLPGTYNIPASAKGKTLSISGSKDAIIAHENQGENGMNYSLEGSTVTFNGVTIQTTSGTYRGFARSAAITYNDCHFVGSYTLGAGSHTFNNCHFNLQNNYVWTWGGEKVVFDGCTFEDENGVGKAILVHNTVDTEVTVKNCSFVATTGAETWDHIPVAAVSIDPNGEHTTKVTFEGTNSVSAAFNGKWQVKYPTLDGHLVTVVE